MLSRINSAYPEKHIHFLSKMSREWGNKKPLQGLRILHNLLNSFETLQKLEPLLLAGADLTVTSADWASIPMQQEVEDLIAQCDIRFVPNYADLKGEFDIGMDCAARILSMKNVKIKHGVVELTQAGAQIYKSVKTPFPVISIDDSFLKNLECMYGTGEAFIRAFCDLTKEDINGKKFILLGYGKIGQGLAKYLSRYSCDVIVFEKSIFAINLALKRGLEAYPIEDSRAQLLEQASTAFAIVTATGVPSILSKYLTAKDVGQSYLANMGVDDEIGLNFQAESRILFNKFPINFSLKHPTLMRYLDPIFYAHNLAAEHLMNEKMSPGFHPFNPQVDREIIREWVENYSESVDDIWENQPGLDLIGV